MPRADVSLPKFVDISLPNFRTIKVPENLARVYENFEPYSVSYLKSKISKDSICVDVGANFGFYSAFISSLIGDGGRVYAFEPSPITWPILRLNMEDYANVVTIQKAVSDKDGFVNFYHTYDYVNSSTVENPLFIPDRLITQIPDVEATRLDNYIATFGELDFIKIDIQGDDVKALLGAKEIIKNSPRLKVMVEWAPHWMKNAGFEVLDLPDTLNDLGFNRLTVLDDLHGQQSSIEAFVSAVENTEMSRRFCNLFAER